MLMAPATTVTEIGQSSGKDIIELNKTFYQTDITINQRSILNSLFFSDDNTDDSGDEKGLSLL